MLDKLAGANCVSWYGHVLRREDSHVLTLKIKGGTGHLCGYEKVGLRGMHDWLRMEDGFG